MTDYTKDIERVRKLYDEHASLYSGNQKKDGARITIRNQFVDFLEDGARVLDLGF